MRRVSAALLALLLSGATWGADDARALIERAVRAEGGEKVLSPRYPYCARVTARGMLGGQKVFATEEIFDARDGRIRVEMHAEVGGTAKGDVMFILNLPQGWKGSKGGVDPLTKEERAQLGISLHVARVGELVPLLRDRGFNLTAVGEVNLEGRPARGMKVSYKGQPDITLCFDKETGLRRKLVYRAKMPGDAGVVTHEIRSWGSRTLDYGAADERLLKEAKLDTTGPGLLAFLRGRTANPARVARVRELVRNLGDDSYHVRERASRELVTLGAVARGPLEFAAQDHDLEVSRRARACLQKIRRQRGEELIAPTVRLLAVRRPQGAAGALLDYLPGADPRVVREVRSALYALARPGGKPDPVLVKALADKDPVRRAAAAAALGKDGGAYAKQPGRRVYPPGIREPTEFASYRELQKVLEFEAVDLQFFNRLDDSLFAKP